MNQKTIWKQTLVQKLVHCMQGLEENGVDISLASTTYIMFAFYYRNGLHNIDRVHTLFEKIQKRELPTMEGVTRAIRKARELKNEWKKSNKEDQIEQFEKEVGYLNGMQYGLDGL